VKTLIVRTVLVALCALTLVGCIQSSDPILIDSQPMFGQRLNLQFYSLGDGVAGEPSQEQFAWNGTLYVRSGGANTVDAFSAYPFGAGDYLIQSAPGKAPQKIEYALLHKLADGVFLARVIDEEDAAAATRAKLCTKSDKFNCQITTRDQLLAFARATAARKHESGGLVLRLPNGS
jgi:hypothetical protein